jgi:DNA repair ATPase RecN
LLSTQERITHIAEMLSGSQPTETALQTAKELMEI